MKHGRGKDSRFKVNHIVIGVLLLAVAQPAIAARQTPMKLDELIARSGLIIEAEVAALDLFAGDASTPKTKVVLYIQHGWGASTGPKTMELWLPEGVEASGDVWSNASCTAQRLVRMGGDRCR